MSNENKFINAVASFSSMHGIPVFVATDKTVYVCQTSPANPAIKNLYDYVKHSTKGVNVIYDSKPRSSMLDVEHIRKLLLGIEKIAQQHSIYNYFVVSDGASITRNNGSAFIRDLRNAQVNWERHNNSDPDEDWNT